MRLRRGYAIGSHFYAHASGALSGHQHALMSGP